MTVAEKAALRIAAKARRDALATPGAAAAVARHVTASRLIPAAGGIRVSAYLAMGSELDPAPLMAALVANGNISLMPAVAARGQPLLFRRWQPGDALVPGPLGTRTPSPEAPVDTPDVLLVPLLAFDAEGYRLGYGGGYYDRTLKSLRAAGPIVAIGMAYAGQEVTSLPHAAYDERLDAVATEKGVRVFA